MKTRYEFIHFEDESGRNWVSWKCSYIIGDVVLGWVIYPRHYDKHIFSPCPNIPLSAQCLLDIADFMGQLKQAKDDKGGK